LVLEGEGTDQTLGWGRANVHPHTLLHSEVLSAGSATSVG